MKFSINWLRQKTGFTQTIEELTHALTMAGLEVGSVEPVAAQLEKVVVGEVITVDKHPDAERLHVCSVNVGQNDLLTIVCGASNVAANMKVAVALVGGQVGDLKIKKAKLRGVASYGMICSSSELGLTQTSQGIMALAHDAPIGQSIKDYLDLNDEMMDLELTPNRGDCLSLEGLAREVCALFDLPYTEHRIQDMLPQGDTQIPIHIHAPAACPRYVGRVIENIQLPAKTPLWLSERLRRSGLRSIDPVVDVMNYVMLELGQPLHAFDLEKIAGEIYVRYAKPNEKITLLNDQTCQLDDNTLIIADQNGPLALAGIMGGKDSAVTTNTRHIFIESAYFNPQVIANKARQYALHSDASHRFERGVDYQLQKRAVEYATELLLSIVKGVAGPHIEKCDTSSLPTTHQVTLHYSNIKKLLGVEVPKESVDRWFDQLGFTRIESTDTACTITTPSYRFDIRIEQDLIEEVARLHGLDNIPSQPLTGELRVDTLDDLSTQMDRYRHTLIDRDYYETVTYSFISPELQTLLGADQDQITLLNPISSDMAVMRTSLLPGLLTAIQYNQARQQSRLRLFEIAACFKQQDSQWKQTTHLAGVCNGWSQEPHWGEKKRAVDFFDMKADVEALLALTGESTQYHWQQISDLPMMHPGQAAALFDGDKKIGIIGALHPTILKKLDINSPVFAFELDFNALRPAKLPKFAKLCKYPSVKRDIAFWVDMAVSAGDLAAYIQKNTQDWLINLQLFDVYYDVAAADKKSLAFSLTLQHPSRTLHDNEVDELMAQLIGSLTQQYSIQLRE